MNFDFSNILTRAWQITWKHKVLWIFGILASCARGNGGGSGSGGNSSGFEGGSDPGGFTSGMNQFTSWLENNWWVIAVLVVFLVGLSLLFVALGYLGRIALVKGTYKAEKGAETLSFGELLSESMPYFWRVFGLSFLVGLIFLVILAPLMILGVVTAGVGFLCIIPLLCVLIPAAIVVNIVLEQANVAIVLEDLGMKDGFKRGWEVVKTNPGPIAIMAIILFVASGIIGLVIAIPVIVAIFPLIFAAASETMTLVWVSIACIALYLPILLGLNGILTTYLQATWVLTFMRLTETPNPILTDDMTVISPHA